MTEGERPIGRDGCIVDIMLQSAHFIYTESRSDVLCCKYWNDGSASL